MCRNIITDDRIWISLALLDNAKLFFQVNVPVYTPTRNIWVLAIAHSHQYLIL